MIRVIGFLFLLFNGFMGFVFLWGGYGTGSSLADSQRKTAVVLGGIFSVLSVMSVFVMVTG